MTEDTKEPKQALELAAEFFEKQEGQRITDAINSDPEEVAKLRKSRKQARAGRGTPLRDAMPDL